MTPHIFAGNPLKRGEVERRDEAWIQERAKNSRSKFLPMCDSKVLISGDAQPALGWLGLADLNGVQANAEAVFLGLIDDTAYFAIDLAQSESENSLLLRSGALRFEDARTAAEHLCGSDAGILAHGRDQINWHNRHGFCSVCGHRTEIKRGGQMRLCPECGSHHFPRVDPVIIAVVHDGERCLLGQSRGRLASTNRYSALAGFVDQGECIEEAVAREVMEEAGIRIKNVRYHSSQPWPFPSSLMIGCHAEAATTDITIDPEEMTDVRWFDRPEVLLALQGRSENLALPGPIAIAHHLIRAWAMKEIS